MPTIHVHTEEELRRGWRYDVQITRDVPARVPGGAGSAADCTRARTTRHVVTLAWADHERWTGGALPPSRLIELILDFLLRREEEEGMPFELPARFDASTARRWFPSLDQALGVRA